MRVYFPNNLNKNGNQPRKFLYIRPELFIFKHLSQVLLTSWHTQKPHLSLGQCRQKNNLLIGFKMPQEQAYFTTLSCIKLAMTFLNKLF